MTKSRYAGGRRTMNDEKAKMLKLTTDQIESKFGQGSIMKLGEDGKELNIGVIPTGALPLDAALGIGGAAYALMVSYAVSSLCSIFYLFRNCRGKWNRPPLCEEGEPTK